MLVYLSWEQYESIASLVPELDEAALPGSRWLAFVAAQTL